MPANFRFKCEYDGKKRRRVIETPTDIFVLWGGTPDRWEAVFEDDPDDRGWKLVYEIEGRSSEQ